MKKSAVSVAPLRLGVVGLRNIGLNHLRRAMSLEGVDVIAVSDIDPGRCQAAKEESGATAVYREMDGLFADERVEAVVLALPNPLHRDATIRAMEAGKHVLVEKPLASFVRDGEAMIEARDRTGKVLMVGYNQRFAGSTQGALRLIRDGAIGAPLYGKTRWNRRDTGFQKRARARGSWQWKRSEAGGGPLMDLGIHKIDLTLHLMGFASWSWLIGHRHDGLGQGALEPLGMTTDIEDFAAAMVRLENDKSLYVESAYYLNMPEEEVNDVVIYGEDGCIAMPQVSEAILYRRDKPGVPEPVEPRSDLGSSPVDHFARVIRGELELSPTAEDGLEVLRMVEAIYRSADEGGRPVERED